MSEEQFNAIIARIDEMQAEMETQFVVVKHRLELIEQRMADVALVLIGHLADHRRGGAA